MNNVVVNVDTNNEVKIYQSLADNNTSSLSDTTKWKEVSLGGGAGGEIGDMGFAPLGIDESLNLRRYLNGQVISQSLSPSFTTKVKQSIALFQNLGTTESNWQSEKTLSKLGQCGKFVVDDTEGTIRLPAVVNAQGLLSLSAIGTIKDESLPNITGANLVQANNTSGCFYGIQNASISTAAGTGTGYGTGFNASRSSSTYQNGAPVQQEAIQYPYYIQIATGVEETLPAIREYKVNNSDFFGKSMYSDVEPDNASWLASNGSYNARAVYPDYYDWLVSHIGETITANGGKVVLSTGTITDYDFVVNQNDQTFRLPLLNGEENLPSDRFDEVTLQASNSPYTAPSNGWIYLQKISTASGQNVAFQVRDADGHGYRGSRLYSSATNQYLATQIFLKRGETYYTNYDSVSATGQYFRFTYAKGNGTLYYYVGDTVQDASLINAGAVLGQLSNKADINASNFNTNGKSLLSGLGMPSNRHIDLTLGASGVQYTAPANGYFVFDGIFDNYNYLAISCSDGQFWCSNVNNAASWHLAHTWPVKKDSVSTISFNSAFSSYTFRFIYADGEN